MEFRGHFNNFTNKETMGLYEGKNVIFWQKKLARRLVFFSANR